MFDSRQIRLALQMRDAAEFGRPSDLQHVNSELHQDMAKMSAKEYGSLLNGMQKQNGADMQANGHLPKLEFSDEHGSGVADSVSAHYSDGSVMTANCDAQQSAHAPASAGAAGGDAPQSVHGGTNAAAGTGGDGHVPSGDAAGSAGAGAPDAAAGGAIDASAGMGQPAGGRPGADSGLSHPMAENADAHSPAARPPAPVDNPAAPPAPAAADSQAPPAGSMPPAGASPGSPSA